MYGIFMVHAQVVTLIRLHLVCPASTATAERSFSELRRIKTYLRNRTSQPRTNNLVILAGYPHDVASLQMDRLLNEFIGRNDLRRNAFEFCPSAD